MEQRLIGFLNKYPYPDDAKEFFLRALDKLADQPAFTELVLRYDSGEDLDWKPSLERVKEAALAAGVQEYTACFLLPCLLAEPLRKRYAARGIAEEIWRDSMNDLYIKFNECRDVKGVYGSFVSAWFGRFFDMTRFTLGRLQFEQVCFIGDSRTLHGVTLVDGQTPVLNVHIPSGGRLPHDSVIDAYRRAYAFFPQLRQNGVLPLQCSSWMLFPALEEILSDGSNILAFKCDYTVTGERADPQFGNCWRFFGVEYTGDPLKLPRDSSLRRGYADWIAAGGTPGSATGFALFDGEKIIKTP